MEELTREEAIRRHRLMWNWIADETEKTGKPIRKNDAFKHCNTETFRMQIDSQRQNQAIINSLDARNWYDTPCYDTRTWYDTPCYEVERSVKVTDNIIETETSLIPHDIKCESSQDGNYEKAAEMARVIANLPEKKEVKEHD